ncbi:winged helix DNA-binding domain-containing protein [Atractiella rhizophila]|nr:winged helix DNA-binding domain-containing protein [Atractiella rhizophila]
MRRTPGIASLTPPSQSSYSSLSTSILNQQLQHLLTTHSTLQKTLHAFAQTHQKRLQTDALFRQRLTELCLEMGVDPLSRNKGVIEGSFLGVGVREWTMALAVQVVDVCRSERGRTGGLIEIGELLKLVSKLRGEDSAPIIEEDLRRAISLLTPLRTYAILTLPSSNITFISSSSSAADGDDTTTIIMCASESEGGWVTEGTLWEWTRKKEGRPWTIERIKLALEVAEVMKGVVWRDERDEGEGGDRWWVPALVEFRVLP